MILIYSRIHRTFTTCLPSWVVWNKDDSQKITIIIICIGQLQFGYIYREIDTNILNDIYARQ